MEDTMDMNHDETAEFPREIILTGEPFFMEVTEEVQADGSKTLHLRGDGTMQLRAVPPAAGLAITR
jgi:hypothetical protein